MHVYFYMFIVMCQCNSIMDMQVPPVPYQPKPFRFPQRTFGVKSFNPSWFDSRPPLDETRKGVEINCLSFKLSEFRSFLLTKTIKTLTQKRTQNAFRGTNLSKFSQGRSPEPPLREGANPLSCSPPLVPSALDHVFRRTTFSNATTALL